MPNGMSLAEGEQAISTEYLGAISAAVQDCLLRSSSPRPGEEEILHLLPALPEHWNAEFRLLARGGFLVTAEARQGRLTRLEICSRRGETCRLRNPWPGSSLLVHHPGGETQRLAGALCAFSSVAGETYTLEPAEEQNAPTVALVDPANIAR